jgi:hypothetical protein
MKKIPFLIIAILSFFSSYGQLAFTESASSLGVGVSYGASQFGGGVSFVDFDGDGWDDITFSSDENNKTYFYKNTNGTFQQVTFPGIDDTYKTKQVLWVDYDNDGDKDFFATSVAGLNKLYRNDNGSFTDITAASGLFTDDLFTYGASFGDIDNDGDLDLFICNRGGSTLQKNYLYRNDAGSFTDISASAGIRSTGELSFCASFFDYDDDGDQDIYIANDKYDNPNRLYRNNGDNTFTDVSVASGSGIYIDAMSTTIGDYNNDGLFDIYVTNTEGGNQLLKNNGDNTFTDTAASTGTSFLSTAWGAVFLDADNDRSLDLYVSGMLDGTGGYLPSAFYHNNGSNVFSIPHNIGFTNDTRESYANAIGDVDNDGLPDILVMNDTDNNFVWKNTTTTSNNWLKIKLEGVSGNKDGIGNKIEVHAGGVSQYRYTICGEGYLGQNSLYEFIGLGGATNVDYVKITWKHSGQVETITNITPNQAITIQEGNGVLSVPSNTYTTVKLYPNPSNTGQFSIFSPQIDEKISIKIYDISGRLVMEQSNLFHTNMIDLQSYAKGIYIAKVTSGTRTASLKLVYR